MTASSIFLKCWHHNAERRPFCLLFLLFLTIFSWILVQSGATDPSQALIGSVEYVASASQSSESKIKEAAKASSFGSELVQAALSVNNKVSISPISSQSSVLYPFFHKYLLEVYFEDTLFMNWVHGVHENNGLSPLVLPLVLIVKGYSLLVFPQKIKKKIN